jgi:hypothetical protein
MQKEEKIEQRKVKKILKERRLKMTGKRKGMTKEQGENGDNKTAEKKQTDIEKG